MPAARACQPTNRYSKREKEKKGGGLGMNGASSLGDRYALSPDMLTSLEQSKLLACTKALAPVIPVD